MHDFTYYAQILISGLTIGSLYALIAIGYTMVYGILRLIMTSDLRQMTSC